MDYRPTCVPCRQTKARTLFQYQSFSRPAVQCCQLWPFGSPDRQAICQVLSFLRTEDLLSWSTRSSLENLSKKSTVSVDLVLGCYPLDLLGAHEVHSQQRNKLDFVQLGSFHLPYLLYACSLAPHKRLFYALKRKKAPCAEPNNIVKVRITNYAQYYSMPEANCQVTIGQNRH